MCCCRLQQHHKGWCKLTQVPQRREIQADVDRKHKADQTEVELALRRDHSDVLCSAHFDESCFDRDHTGYYSSFGLKRSPRLLPNAVPSRFPVSHESQKEAEPPGPQVKQRRAFAKMEKMRVSHGDGYGRSPTCLPRVGQATHGACHAVYPLQRSWS